MLCMYTQVRGVMVRALQACEAAPGGGSGSGDEDEVDDEPSALRLHRVLAAIFAECTRVRARKPLFPHACGCLNTLTRISGTP